MEHETMVGHEGSRVPVRKPHAGERLSHSHTMRSEVGYLFSGLWKGRREGGRAESERQRERDKKRGGQERRERQKLPLQEGDRKEETKTGS